MVVVARRRGSPTVCSVTPATTDVVVRCPATRGVTSSDTTAAPRTGPGSASTAGLAASVMSVSISRVVSSLSSNSSVDTSSRPARCCFQSVTLFVCLA